MGNSWSRVILFGADAEASKLAEALESLGATVLQARDPSCVAASLADADQVVQVIAIPPGLTRRERQVAVLRALGLGEKDVAKALGIAPSTVRTLRARVTGRQGHRASRS